MSEEETTSTVTPAIVSPVTLAEAKLYLRIDGTDEDSAIAAMLAAAVGEAECIIHARLNSQSIVWAGAEPGVLPERPVSAVSVTVDGTEVSSSLYLFAPSEGTGPAFIEWLEDFPEGEPTVTMTVGFSAQTLPAPIRQWILARTSTFYEQREMFAANGAYEFGHEFYNALLDPYITHGGF